MPVLIGLLTFVFVLSLRLAVAGLAGARRTALRDRILDDETADELVGPGGQPETGGWLAALELEARQAGVQVDRRMLLYIMLGIGLLAFLVLLFSTGNVVLALAGLLLGRLAPSRYLRWLIRRRASTFERQFEAALTQMANAMRAGEALMNAVRNVGEMMPDPIGYEFRRVYQDMRLGTPQIEAFRRLGERVRSDDYQMFLATVDLQTQAGGNMIESFEQIAATIRDRQRARERVNSKTAQGRYSGYFISALPVIVAIGLSLVMPSYLAYFLGNAMGRLLLVLMGVMVVVGWLWIQRIVNIRFE